MVTIKQVEERFKKAKRIECAFYKGEFFDSSKDKVIEIRYSKDDIVMDFIKGDDNEEDVVYLYNEFNNTFAEIIE